MKHKRNPSKDIINAEVFNNLKKLRINNQFKQNVVVST